ncbi:amino acid ABC transporter permease [Cryptosporangium aurantiacum]|uniref:amino acid ABC transporter permease n=1 Tax=Cryptosporangium aurantiacum TaxID=134849 RepID=UPI0015BE56FD|nr:amino acid ABC transporter permease [Cryptosporangium aurantiacum]
MLTENAGFLAEGLLTTVALAVVSFLGALLLGTALGIARVGSIHSLRTLAALYVGTVRNMPALLILIVIVFVLPEFGVVLDLELSLTTGLVLYFATYVCEIVRSGVNTVGRGQLEAALSLGLSYGQALTRVIVPQTLRAMVQPLGTLFMATTMATSIGSVIGVRELAGSARILNGQYAEPAVLFGLVAVLYIALALLIARLTRVVENRARVLR